MDPITAKQLYHEYGVVLCLGAPTNETLEFGIDTNSWVTGPQFKGIKLIPLGIHYVFYSVKNKYGGDSAPRTSFFLDINKGDVHVLQWNAQIEQFDFLSRDDSAAYVRGVKEYEFDANLGTYPMESLAKWTALSSHLTNSIIRKLQPIGAQIVTSGKALSIEERRELDEAMEEMGLEQETREEELDNLNSEAQCYYTPIPRLTTSKTSAPAEITALHMDRSSILEKMITKDYNNNPNNFLGELQFCFICFLLGQSFEGFEQWKSLILLVLGCESAVYDRQRVTFWLDLIRILQTQLSEAPEDFFIDIVEGSNFLHVALCDFFEITADPATSEPIRRAVEDFHSFVEDRFGIPFDTTAIINEEDAPVIVEI